MFGSGDSDDVTHVWELMEKIGFCMLASLDGEEIRSRPMAAYLERDENRIYFLTDKDSYKDEEIAADPHVNLAFADAGSHSYVAVTGRATLSNDRDKIRDLFNIPAKAWWDSPEDPAIRLLAVEPNEAQYWDSPGKVRAYFRMAAAAVSSARPAMGENAKVEMSNG
ncbi:MAG TPA: pyridoxamine 5'-phosphate oxidase family protein [Methylobacterium sp.]|jgi:general stress protein 26|nr:pyridoxamine 5'-phosphate oxidase family protein [Methylobacterium sp.]